MNDIIERVGTGLIFFGARPGMGLTRFSLKIASTYSMDERVLFISYQHYELYLKKIITEQNGHFPKWLKINANLEYYNLEWFGKLADLIKKSNASWVFIDDLDSLLGEHFRISNDEKELLIEGLKEVSDELGIGLVVNVTVSERVEHRGGEMRPKLRDFTWARSIAELADRVYSIYRPFNYGITQDETGKTTDKLIEIEYLKNSRGIDELIYLDNDKFKILPEY